MMSKGSKLRAGREQASTKQVLEMLHHFKDQMGTISLGVADLIVDLQVLNNSLAHWAAYYGALQDSPAKSSTTRPRTAKPHTSNRRKA